MAAGLGLGEKGHEGVVRRVLVEPVQVEPRGYRVEPTLQAAEGPPVEGSRGGWPRWWGRCSPSAPGGNLGRCLRFARSRSLGGLDRGGGRRKRWDGILPAGPVDSPHDLANGVVPERQLEGGRDARAATHQRCDPDPMAAAADRQALELVARRGVVSNAGWPNTGRTASGPTDTARFIPADTGPAHEVTLPGVERIGMRVTARSCRRSPAGADGTGSRPFPIHAYRPPSDPAPNGADGPRAAAPRRPWRPAGPRVGDRRTPGRDHGPPPSGLAHGVGSERVPTTAEPWAATVSARHPSSRFTRAWNECPTAAGDRRVDAGVVSSNLSGAAEPHPAAGAFRAAGSVWRRSRRSAGRGIACRTTERGGAAAPGLGPGGCRWRRPGALATRATAAASVRRRGALTETRAPSLARGIRVSSEDGMHGSTPGIGRACGGRPAQTHRAAVRGNRVADRRSFVARGGGFEAPSSIRGPSGVLRRSAARAAGVVRARRARSRAGCRRCEKGP